MNHEPGRETFADDAARASEMQRSIAKYERDEGADDFTAIISGALIAENGTTGHAPGSGYPQRYPQ